MPNRALVIEGEHGLRSALATFFRGSSLDLYGAPSIEDARALLPVVKPAIAIVDRELRDGDGLDLIGDVVRLGARAMIVSTRNSTDDRIKALTLGASEYLGKPASAEEIYLRVRNLLATPTPANDDPSLVRDFGGVRIDLATRAILRPDNSHGDELTDGEIALLRVLVQNINQIVSREELYAAATGEALPERPSRAIDTRVSGLRIKLRAAEAEVEIRSIRQAGYMLQRSRAARAAQG